MGNNDTGLFYYMSDHYPQDHPIAAVLVCGSEYNGLIILLRIVNNNVFSLLVMYDCESCTIRKVER